MTTLRDYGVVVLVGAFFAAILGGVSAFVSFFLLDGMWAKGLMGLVVVAFVALKIKADLKRRKARKARKY